MKIGNLKFESERATLPVQQDRNNDGCALRMGADATAAAIGALSEVIRDLRAQNRELHDRVLVLARENGAQLAGQLAGVRGTDRQVVRVESPEPATALVDEPAEVPGTQVGDFGGGQGLRVEGRVREVAD